MKHPESKSSSFKSKQYAERRRRPPTDQNDSYASMENSPEMSRNLSRQFSSSSRPQSVLLSEDLPYFSSRPQSQYFTDDPTLSPSALSRSESDLSSLFVSCSHFPVLGKRETNNFLKKGQYGSCHHGCYWIWEKHFHFPPC